MRKDGCQLQGRFHTGSLRPRWAPVLPRLAQPASGWMPLRWGEQPAVAGSFHNVRLLLDCIDHHRSYVILWISIDPYRSCRCWESSGRKTWLPSRPLCQQIHETLVGHLQMLAQQHQKPKRAQTQPENTSKTRTCPDSGPFQTALPELPSAFSANSQPAQKRHCYTKWISAWPQPGLDISISVVPKSTKATSLSLSLTFYVFVARFGCGKSCPGIAGPPKPFPPCLFPSSSDLHSPVSQSSIIQYPPQILHPQGCSSASPEVTASPGHIWTACCACCACAAKFCSGAFSRSGACKGNRM